MADKNLTKEEKESLQFTEQLENMKQYAKAVDDILKLVDLTSSTTKTWTVFSKDNLRSYLQNPYSSSSQNSLRNLSKFLYTLSFPLRRIINYFASLPDFSAYKVNLDFSLVEDNNEETLLKDYEDACRFVRKMNLEINMFKLLVIAWREGIVYFQPYQDDDGTMLLMPLDSQYCKVSSVGYNNLLHVAFDFSFFNGSNSYYLDIYDPIFKKMYNKYQSDSSLRWQELPIENTFCLKINIDNLDYPIPPLSGLLEDIINLEDLQSVQNLKDEMEAYKLIYAKIDTLSGTKDVDDFEIDLDLANAFYQKLQDALPDNVALAMSPMKLDSIDFKSNDAEDSNIISKAYENIINANGGIVLNQNKITNSTSFKLALQFDSMDAVAPIEQVNEWINLWIRNHLGETGMIVEFDDTSPYFVNDKIDQLLKASQYGIPVKLQLSSLINTNPVKERGMSFMEKALGLTTTSWNKPLVSSNVQSGISENGDGSDGRPLKNGPLSDEGEATRDDEKNDK